MNIVEADVHRLTIPLAGEFTSSHGGKSSIPTVLVVLRSAGGKSGLGTADPIPTSDYYTSAEEIFRALAQDVLPELIAKSPVSPNACRRLLAGLGAAKEVRLAAEMAYMDLYGRETGQSVSTILGGRLRDTEPLNGWVGVDDPDAMATEAVEFADAGFTGLKMKVAGNVEADIDRVEAVWNAVGDTLQVRVDANAAYSVDEALALAELMAQYDITHFEQPIDGADIDGLERITDATDIPIMADEAVRSQTGLEAVISRRAADRIKLKIIGLGGLLDTHQAIASAALHGFSCVVGHGYGTLPATSAELQVTAANETVFRPVETVGTLKIADEPFISDHELAGHAMRLQDTPGLGISLDEDALPSFVDEATTVTETVADRSTGSS